MSIHISNLFLKTYAKKLGSPGEISYLPDVEHEANVKAKVMTLFEFDMIDEKSEALSMLSDMYKDTYGFRPRGLYKAEDMTLEDINNEMDLLSEIMIQNEEQDAIICNEKIEEFKRLINRTIIMGAEDEDEALKWLFQASDIRFHSVQDVEHFVWQYGFLFSPYGKDIVMKLLKLLSPWSESN